MNPQTSQFFNIPANVMFIVQESCTLSSSDPTLNGKIIGVKPVTHDEYNKKIGNPYKKPNSRKAWRMDIGYDYNASAKTTNKKVELFAVDSISEYSIRYLRKPDPIILVDFEEDTDLAGHNLTIDGFNKKKTSFLGNGVHRTIIKYAVGLATKDYNNSQAKA